MGELKVIGGPRLRHGAVITFVGYALNWGVPFASFSILPRLFDAENAAKTSQNILAHPVLFAAVIFAFFFNFIGDIVSAWGMHLLVRGVNESISMFVAWVRVVFAAMGFAAVLNLITAWRLLFKPSVLIALGQAQRDAQVVVAIGAFNTQFDFSLMLFGVYLIMVGLLSYRSGTIPKWLSLLLIVDGTGWMVMEAGPLLFPGVDFGFLFFTSFAELILMVWLAGWGSRLKDYLGSPSASS